MTREFSTNVYSLTVGTWDLSTSETFPVVGLVANKMLLYRIRPDGTKHFIYIPSEVLEEAAHTMNNKPIDWNHEKDSRTLGYYKNARFKNNKLTGELTITDPKYALWVKKIRDSGQIPNISPEFINRKASKIDVEGGILEICYDIEFRRIALTEKGVCTDADGCGIREFNMTETADTFWLDFVSKLCKDRGSELVEWSTAKIDELPDTSFAYVEPGQKDEGGRTVPRSNRHLPFRDENRIDLAHLQHALAHLPEIPSEARALAKTKLVEAAKKVSRQKEDKKMTEEKSPCGDETKKLSDELNTRIGEIEEKLESFGNVTKQLSEFMEKFTPKKEEKKELSQEDIIQLAIEKATQTALDQQERTAVLKELAQKGVTGVDNLSLEALKSLKVEVKIPEGRKTLFADDDGKPKSLSDMTEQEKDVATWYALNQSRGRGNRADVPISEIKKYLANDKMPDGWWGPNLIERARNNKVI